MNQRYTTVHRASRQNAVRSLQERFDNLAAKCAKVDRAQAGRILRSITIGDSRGSADTAAERAAYAAFLLAPLETPAQRDAWNACYRAAEAAEALSRLAVAEATALLNTEAA